MIVEVYRDYIIYDKPESYKPASARFEFRHRDYDVDDNRSGFAGSIAEAKSEIDERIDP